LLPFIDWLTLIGESYKYVWPVPERSGPSPTEGSSVLWLYHSHTNELTDVQAGLVGPIIISRKGMANNTTKVPLDVDKEFVILFQKVDENSSPYLAQNILRTQQPQNVVASNSGKKFRGTVNVTQCSLIPT
jgi:FtsP/CotA-like multicopper oxidase with cupredoxin domain